VNPSWVSKKGIEIGQEEESSSPRVVKGRRSHAEDDGKIKSGRCQDRKGVEANDWRDRGQGASTWCVAGYKELEHDPDPKGRVSAKWAPVFPRDKRGTRLRGDHAQT
jgi:hypothetical protein